MQQMDVQLGAVKGAPGGDGAGSAGADAARMGGQPCRWAPVWQQLSANHTLYIPDFPGFGQSDPPEAPWDVAAYAQMVCHLMDAPGPEKMRLCGAFLRRPGAAEAGQRAPRAGGPGGHHRRRGPQTKRGAKYYLKVYSYKLCKWLARALGPLGKGVAGAHGPAGGQRGLPRPVAADEAGVHPGGQRGSGRLPASDAGGPC